MTRYYTRTEILRGKTVAEVIDEIKREVNITPYSHADMLLLRLEQVFDTWRR